MGKEHSRSFTASLDIPVTPWDVYELLADADQQTQWRDRFAPFQDVTRAEPYTLVAYGNGLVFGIEPGPEGSGTTLTVSKSWESSGAMGAIGLRLFGKKAQEEELLALLRRVESVLLYDGI
ncbi:hypothetical protein GKE82_09725 [Conexibacter sp. W3-3-2]|uniref:SRPBCC family protein n=1 Tax=Paraconexibacter algicola TaxID=2133960 RepID=A0A2T4UGC1_9ACTN|nr:MULTISPECIES: hypothetical protein [Solirubrobacterales]MTD44560.1 hypothetical protein [Conexibacter sp. W3-3-2]PTL58304.1 hypothetical protein C7Y72_00890 [Paraconexibacter algicola]